jgi:hypothetical protein
MPLFICRWHRRQRVIEERCHEVGNAETCELFTMVHFRLKQETDEIDDFVPVELEGFGEQTVDMLCDRVYPDYFHASITEGENWPDEEDMTATLRSPQGTHPAGGEIKEPKIRRLTSRKLDLIYRRLWPRNTDIVSIFGRFISTLFLRYDVSDVARIKFW